MGFGTLAVAARVTNEDNGRPLQTKSGVTAGYLFILLPVQVALLSVGVMPQELGKVRHDGFLIRLVYVNICGGTN